MELWIRSQDKQILTKIEEIELVDNEDYFTLETIHYVLGEYKTKERALEVLDEIQNYINSDIYWNLDVFEMPKE